MLATLVPDPACALPAHRAQIGGAPERKEAAACAKLQARAGGAGDASHTYVGNTPTITTVGTA